MNGDSESEEEAIVVTREKEEIDPEFEAEFDREYAKIMAESFDTRKFERKQQFDIPLPILPKNRDIATSGETGEGGAGTPGGTMAFSLLTKRGNRQQVSVESARELAILDASDAVPNSRQTRTVELPSDSTFAVAMINQRQAAKEEQQRIKNLVLNLDLGENEDNDGEENLTPYGPNTNIHHVSAGPDKPTSHYHHNRADNKSGKDRAQRVRRLQLSDVDWYENPGKGAASRRAPFASRKAPIPHSRRRNT